MEKLKIKMEIELKDVINSVLIIFGGILTYCLITSVEVTIAKSSLENEKLKTRFLILEKVDEKAKELTPNLKINYTNQFSKNKDTLYVKVYVKNIGEHSVFYTSPNLYLISGKETVQYYNAPNLFDYWGDIYPGQELKITYLAYDYAKDSIPEFIRMRYPVTIKNNVNLKLVEQYIKSDEDKALLDWITNKDYLYEEKAYNFGKNGIWADFFSNPR
jgi:hypothetical protein